MSRSSITEEQALFIATLPDVFSDLDSAIRIHSFINRVASIHVDNARNAIDFGLRANLVEVDGNGRVRLAGPLRHERESLEASEGNFEVAVFELGNLILAQSNQ